MWGRGSERHYRLRRLVFELGLVVFFELGPLFFQ
jgi:hypothetical protein